MATKDKDIKKPEYDAHGEKIIRRGKGFYVTDEAVVITELDWDNPRNQPNHAFPSKEDLRRWEKKNRGAPMATKRKQGDTMRTGPGWTLVDPSAASFTATLREVLHTGRGERIAIFRVRKRKYIPKAKLPKA